MGRAADDGAPGQLVFELGHTPSHARDDLLVGEGNRLALAHLLAYPDWPGPLTLLTGPEKSGKSHLARIFAEHAGAAIAGPDEVAALAGAADLSPLVIEDVDRAGFDEHALFHLVNRSMRSGRAVLLTARAPVPAWPYRTDDLKSRARLAAHFAVALTDDIQLSQMLAKLFEDRQVAVAPKIIAYLVARMERSPAEAVILAERLDRAALARGSAITRAIAAEVLAARAAELGREGEAFEGEDDDDE